jgi:hypothetical protein
MPQIKRLVLAKPIKRIALFFAWFLCFTVGSVIMYEYEIIMNYPSTKLTAEQVWVKGAPEVVTQDNRKTNLVNEGAVGYGILTFVMFSAVMFCREILNAYKIAKADVLSLRLLSIRECTEQEFSLVGEVKI